MDMELDIIGDFIDAVLKGAYVGFYKSKFEILDLSMTIDTFLIIDEPMIDVRLYDKDEHLIFWRVLPNEDIKESYQKWAEEVSE